MGLDKYGFSRPRLNDIKREYDQRFIDALGPINTNPDSVAGQIIGIFSAALDDLWEAVQHTYDAMYPSSAEGVSLDGAVSLVGLERLGATPTTVVAMCYGSQDTVIPAGSMARSTDNRQYVTTTSVTISSINAGDVEITVSTVENGAAYHVTVDGSVVTYTSGPAATDADIAAGIAAMLDPIKFLATSSGGVLRIRSADQYSGFSIVVDNKLTITKLGSPVNFSAVEVGAYVLPVGSLNKIDSSVLGWNEVFNLVPGDTGRFIESDEELRARHAKSVRYSGAATVQAIRARILQEVDSVSDVSVYENRTHQFVGSMPPHSFETVVSGGSNQAVAKKIWEVKPAGIETCGNVSIEVMDDNGDLQLIRFTRPVDKYAFVRVSVNTLYTEEPLPASVVYSIISAVVSYGNTLGIGNDIITQRFYGPIYAATSGIGSITVDVALTNAKTDVPVYTSGNISVDYRERAVFDSARVYVLGV